MEETLQEQIKEIEKKSGQKWNKMTTEQRFSWFNHLAGE